ncbi:hypothetical protein [Gordonia rubripertincta]|uniref:hypothetical protein n=1 Tax=Gordonia rubripertincta TaxID=36822 RepID=UPI0015FB626D|nr:hypothetical protein [Gordonia rubripertincta]QMU19339.1 hypothetical protein H3V45_14695 [Gordonia rubripertincta]
MTASYEAKLVYGLNNKGPLDACGCHYCNNEWLRIMEELDPEGWMSRINSGCMILCRECGNKRCPKATYHGHACTHSNESGQQGSVYGGFLIDESWRQYDD